jgi:hypothetical protein
MHAKVGASEVKDKNDLETRILIKRDEYYDN